MKEVAMSTCPSCGGRVVVLRQNGKKTEECKDCGAKGPFPVYSPNLEAPAVEEVVEEVVEEAPEETESFFQPVEETIEVEEFEDL
jgi:ribosomal protein L37AE/L43A